MVTPQKIAHGPPDEDVQAEEQRIENTPMSQLLISDALLLKNLSKTFWSFPAVDNICVGMPANGESLVLLL